MTTIDLATAACDAVADAAAAITLGADAGRGEMSEHTAVFALAAWGRPPEARPTRGTRTTPRRAPRRAR